MRLIFLLFLSLASLSGRDNPFFPTDPNEKQTPTTNKVEALKPFSTQKISLPNSARAIKAVIIRYQNLDGSITNEELELNNKIDWHKPLVISHEKTPANQAGKKRLTTINAKFIKFRPFENTLKLVTEDKMLRHFMLASPPRVVMDFSRDTSFRPKNFVVNKPPYKNIRMGNHDHYYRVVIELDGQYRYKLQLNEKGTTIVCY